MQEIAGPMDVETGRKRTGFLVVGVILVVVGAVWTGQGAGFIAGSFMTGQAMWLVIGIIGIGIGLGLIGWSRRRRTGRPPQA